MRSSRVIAQLRPQDEIQPANTQSETCMSWDDGQTFGAYAMGWSLHEGYKPPMARRWETPEYYGHCKLIAYEGLDCTGKDISESQRVSGARMQMSSLAPG